MNPLLHARSRNCEKLSHSERSVLAICFKIYGRKFLMAPQIDPKMKRSLCFEADDAPEM